MGDATARVIASAKRCVAMYDSILRGPMNDTRPDWLDGMREGLKAVESAPKDEVRVLYDRIRSLQEQLTVTETMLHGEQSKRGGDRLEAVAKLCDEAVTQSGMGDSPYGIGWNNACRQLAMVIRTKRGALSTIDQLEQQLSDAQASIAGHKNTIRATAQREKDCYAEINQLQQQLADAQSVRDAVFDEGIEAAAWLADNIAGRDVGLAIRRTKIHRKETDAK